MVRVLDYLEANYELSSSTQIYLAGDGAPWIRQGTEYIPEPSLFWTNFTWQSIY